MSIVLLIDTSGSMLGTPLDKAKEATRQFVDKLDAADQVAIYSLNLTTTLHTDGFITDRGALKNLLGSSEIAVPSADGWTCLYDAMYSAIQLAANQPSGRKALVVLSDGEDVKDRNGTQCSKHTVGEVIEDAQDKNVPLYAIGLGKADLPTLQRLTSATRGETVIYTCSGRCRADLGDISTLLKEQYVLSVISDPVGQRLITRCSGG